MRSTLHLYKDVV